MMAWIICLVILVAFIIVAVVTHLNEKREKKEKELDLQRIRKKANIQGGKRGRRS